MVQPIPDPKFCCLCGALLEQRVPTGDHRPRAICPHCGFVHYRQPKIAAGTVVETDGCLVLIRRAVEPRKGYWSFPCGFQEIDETVDQAAVRETEEETGLRVDVLGHLGTYSYVQTWYGGAVVVVAYRARIVGGELQPGDDAMEAKLVRPDEIPWNDLAFKSTTSAFRDWIALRSRV
ncbi:MAG: NUDIX hydrolase [Planctomycetes bacterium]|nr:NUDIX hydrolase [Planctomycetota bacterium]